MNTAVREYLEKKLSTARLRQLHIAENANYEHMELCPANSKAFGFPDNSMIVDPDAAILNLGFRAGATNIAAAATPNKRNNMGGDSDK